MDPVSNKKTLSNKLIISFFVINILLFVVLLYTTISSNNRLEDILNDQAIEIMNIRWEAYKYRNNKIYIDKNIENKDKKNYFETHNLIDKHNFNFMNNKTSYEMKYYDNIHIGAHGYNAWSIFDDYFYDMSYGTFVSTKQDWELPDSVDWRNKGAVTKVKDQGGCGSCWAFSVLGALEAQYFLKTGKLVSLSVQQLVDCGYKTSNDACRGGSLYSAFEYLRKYGVVANRNYPYYGMRFMCPNLSHKRSIKIDKHIYIQQGSEQDLKEAVATIGPIAVTIWSYTDRFKYYYRGISEGTYCNILSIDHGVLVVGYGTDPIEGDYWLIKNSWGKYWGENGYIRLRRNQNNRSCIGILGAYPVFAENL